MAHKIFDDAKERERLETSNEKKQSVHVVSKPTALPEVADTPRKNSFNLSEFEYFRSNQIMQRIIKTRLFCVMKLILAFVTVAFSFQTSLSRAANFVMSGTDVLGTASFNSGLNWTGGAAPAAGNTYQTGAFLLRTPQNSTSIAFAGDSLEVQNGGDLRDKTSATVTITNFILDNGGIFDVPVASSTLAGNTTLSGGMAYISDNVGETFTCSSVISGPGGFYTFSTVSTGAGITILTGANTFLGPLIVNGGTLVLGTGGSLASTNITVASGTTLDVSAVNFTLGSNQSLSGSGTVTGSVSTVFGSQIYAGTGGTYGTNTFNNNLTFVSGASAYFDLGSTAGGANDQIVLNGAGSVLTCGGASIGINCGATLDQANDYVLFTLTGGSASIAGNFNTTPVWTGTTPVNATNYSIVTESNSVILHYNNTSTTNLPAVTNLAASAISPASATLNGEMLSSGGQIPMVSIYYGTSDGGTNPAAWTTNVVLGLQNGSFAAVVSNLTANTTYYFAASASNSAGTAWATPSLSFTNPVPIPAVVTNLAATSVQSSSAMMNGQILSIGSQTPVVTLYYGTADGGINPGAWATNVVLGLQNGSFAAVVSNLTANTMYYFAASASNSAGTAWSVPSQSFTTLTLSSAVVTNLPASNLQGSSATLNGQVLSIGSQTPVVTLYYGTVDGGKNPTAWMNNINLGQQNGSFDVTITGLSTNTTYYYAAAATNSGGLAWATPSASFTTPIAAAATTVSVTTYHYDNTRAGANTNEVLLTLANVNVNTFGRLFTYSLDGYVYAEPLIVTNVAIPGQGTHNVVYVATENDSVYAFDADNNTGTNGGLLWHTNLGIAALSNNQEFGGRYNGGSYIDIVPEVGITGTPVIDPVSGTLYVDVLTREVTTTTNYYHRIHALKITNGIEQPYSPVVVTASVPGTGVDSSNGMVSFNARQQNQRPALTLAGGNLYVAYGSFADTDPFHGWVIGFNATNLVQLTNYIFNTTPNATTAAFGANAGEGALWMGGNGLNVDANTNLYFETANGSFSANTNGGDYSDSFVKLSTSNNLVVADYFTPYDQQVLANGDDDLGSGGPLLLPDCVGSTNHPHLIVGCGKEGKIYLLDRDFMGNYNSANDNQIVQEIPNAVGGTWSSPAYFNNQIYYQGSGDVMKAFLITNGVIVTSPISKSATSYGYFGATPVISANGTNNVIAWSTDSGAYAGSGPGVLHAYNATNLALELYNSSQNLARDNPGGAVKMTTPTVANGKVYVGAEYALSVYGNAIFLATPLITPNGGFFTNSVLVTLSDTTAGASIYYTLDGTAPSTNSILYTGSFVLMNSASVHAIATAPGSVNSGVAVANFINSSAIGNGSGLLGAYYASSYPATPYTGSPTLIRTDEVVNFNWSSTGPDPSVGQTHFTVRWTGSVQAQFNETYTFYATADDGVRLWVNGQELVNGWVDQGATTYQGTITFNAQQLYNIEMDYYQNGGGAVAELQWSSPSTAQAIVPQTQLYPYTNPPPSVVMASPAGGSTYTAPASVTVGANADAPYNPVGTVSFYANGALLGTLSNSVDAPLYEMTVPGLAAGSYALTAVATDGSGLSSTSAPVNITVNAGSGLPYGLTNTLPVSAFLNMPTTFNGTLPALLSQTGAFSDTTNRIPAGGLIPYVPNTILWSDGAVKSRYMALPNNGGTLTPDQQISFLPTNSLDVPGGDGVREELRPRRGSNQHQHTLAPPGDAAFGAGYQRRGVWGDLQMAS
jgi:autotransporter-associated beta strand protein